MKVRWTPLTTKVTLTASGLSCVYQCQPRGGCRCLTVRLGRPSLLLIFSVTSLRTTDLRTFPFAYWTLLAFEDAGDYGCQEMFCTVHFLLLIFRETIPDWWAFSCCSKSAKVTNRRKMSWGSLCLAHYSSSWSPAERSFPTYRNHESWPVGKWDALPSLKILLISIFLNIVNMIAKFMIDGLIVFSIYIIICRVLLKWLLVIKVL